MPRAIGVSAEEVASGGRMVGAARSTLGRVAWQFIQEVAGTLGKRLEWP